MGDFEVPFFQDTFYNTIICSIIPEIKTAMINISLSHTYL